MREFFERQRETTNFWVGWEIGGGNGLEGIEMGDGRDWRTGWWGYIGLWVDGGLDQK